MNALDYIARDFAATRKLKKAIYCLPLGLGTFERVQRKDETLVEGLQGFYFVKRAEGTKAWYYEYFGAYSYNPSNGQGFKDGYAHLTKADTIKMLKARLNLVTAQ